MSGDPAALPAAKPVDEADLERRFAGLRRLYGDDGYRLLRAARVAVVGVGVSTLLTSRQRRSEWTRSAVCSAAARTVASSRAGAKNSVSPWA